MTAAVDAGIVRDAMVRYAEALRAHREEIDSLNVFPVPDGDTGTNLFMTQQAVAAALEGADGADLVSVGAAISRAALMGARGNSGVILSQVLRGLCARMCREASAGPEDLAEGIAQAAEEARRAVAEPVEGTMLTVLRDAATAAGAACRGGADCDGVADAAFEAAVESLRRTPEQLPALAEAGVVDAGAKGLVLLFDALDAALRGRPMQVEVGPAGPVRQVDPGAVETRYGYEVMYLLEAADPAIGPLRRKLGDIGDSLVVVGGGGLYSVHVHTDDPGSAVEIGLSGGRPRNIRITSLDAQVAEACLAGEARGVRVAERDETSVATALVTLAPGEGIGALFRSLGAVVLPAGATAGDLLDGIAAVEARGVLLLPNDEDARAAVEAAAADSEVPAGVVATASVPEGLAAATAVVADDDLETNLRRAAEAAHGVASGTVERAERDVHTPTGIARAGAFVGFTDGRVAVTGGPELPRVAAAVVAACRRDRHEIVTVIAGEGIVDHDAQRVVAEIGEANEELEVEWHRGGQAAPLLIGLE